MLLILNVPSSFSSVFFSGLPYLLSSSVLSSRFISLFVDEDSFNCNILFRCFFYSAYYSVRLDQPQHNFSNFFCFISFLANSQTLQIEYELQKFNNHNVFFCNTQILWSLLNRALNPLLCFITDCQWCSSKNLFHDKK